MLVRMTAALPFVLAATVAGCDTTPGASEPPEDACNSAAFAHFVGQPEPTEAELAAIDGPERIRVIAPGQAVTMDYLAFRLNIELDDNGNVTRVYCG